MIKAATQAVMQDGAAGFIRKPFDHIEFSHLIQQVLGHQTMHHIQRFVPLMT